MNWGIDKEWAISFSHIMAASKYYHRALRRGRFGNAWSKLSGESNDLNDLQQIASSQIKNRYTEPGIKTVQIDQIRGSEGRAHDFDRNFNPRQMHTRERWQTIACLILKGRNLPPIELVCVGDQYFVRDGHHRVSVARTMGRLSIEAKVVRLQVEGALPWEQSERKEFLSKRFASTVKAFVIRAASTISNNRKPDPKTVCMPEQSGCTYFTSC